MSKLRITPIGTCRILTPLKRATLRYPIELDLRRNYGFVHTSAEAVQQLRFLQGEKQFSPEVAPLVLREADPAALEAERWETADLHVVEISSSKRISYGADTVQGNYVQRYFSDFFASAERSRAYWNLVKKGHRQNLLKFLQEQAAYRLLGPEDRRLLRDLSMEQQSFKAIKADMAEIIDRLGHEKVIFVTHVNAITPDGAVIPTRDRLIRWVKLAANQLAAAAFDPTPIMEEFGQERALESGGLDLTHYTLPFSDRLYDALHQAHVAARLSAQALRGDGVDEEQRIGALAAHLEAMLELGDFFSTSREVYEALRKSPDALPLIELRGLIRSRIGDYSGAVADLRRRDDLSVLSQSMRVALLEALTSEAQHEAALQLAEQLLGEEFESARIYRYAASAAEQSGRPELAIQYAKQAYRMDRGDLSTALHALVLLTRRVDQAEAAEWRRELLENIEQASNGAFELATWAVEHRDEDLFAAAIQSVAAADKGGTIDLAEEALNSGLTLALARSIPLLSMLGTLPRPLAQRRTAILATAVEQIEERLESGATTEAYELASAVVRLADVPNSQIAGARLASQAQRFMRIITRHVRSEVRAAFTAGRPEDVVSAGAGAGDILASDPDTAVIVARALEAVGERKKALMLLKRVQADNPESFHVRRWAGRYAALEQDYATALEMYGSLKEHDESAAIQQELGRFFATAERRALKQLRKLADEGRHGDALELAAALARHLGPLERTERELMRMHRLLRLELKEVDEGAGELEDREPILRKLIRIRPDDQSALRRLALELMRQFRFAEAAAIWERLHLLDPSNESADRNRVRCATLAERRASDSVAEVNEVA